MSVSFHQLWMAATNLGDSAVMLPCIALVTLWLATPAATRALAWRWLLLVVGVMSVVAVSKLAFMGWLISLPGLNFTGLSGHSTTSAVVWPALGALLGRRRGPHMQAWGALLGLLIALAVSFSRLVLHAHSVSEAVLGSLTGATASLVFLYRHRAHWCLPERTWVAVLSLLLVLPWVYGDRFPSETLLKGIASQLSGHAPYRREDLRRARHPAPDHAVVPVR